MLELIEHFHVNLMQASQDNTSYQLSTVHKSVAFLTSVQYSISLAKIDAAFQFQFFISNHVGFVIIMNCIDTHTNYFQQECK